MSESPSNCNHNLRYEFGSVSHVCGVSGFQLWAYAHAHQETIDLRVNTDRAPRNKCATDLDIKLELFAKMVMS